MDKISDIIRAGEYKNPVVSRLFHSNCTSEKFTHEFISATARHLYFSDEGYVVDFLNKEVINQLYYYLIGSNRFSYDLRKGILLAGSVGCGKTVIMESFVEVFNKNTNKVVKPITSRDIATIVLKEPAGFLHKRPLFIDDIGKEEINAKSFGNTIHPLEDLINARYKTSGLTFGTTNLSWEDMQYSKHVIDRMQQMFNYILLPGNSRR